MPGDDPSFSSMILDSLNRVEGKLDSGLARVEAKMDSKADKVDLAEIRGELKSHGADIAALKEATRIRSAENNAVVADAKDKQDRRTRRTTIALSVLGTAALVVSVLEAFIIH